MTDFGKICVIKTLMLPKLAHIAAILPNISRKKIEEIEKVCLKFHRTNKKSIVDSSMTLYATNAQNGLGLTRISEFWTALKISWLKRFVSSYSFWTTLKREWLYNLGCANLDPRCTDSKVVDLICKKKVLTHFGEMYIKDLEFA